MFILQTFFFIDLEKLKVYFQVRIVSNPAYLFEDSLDFEPRMKRGVIIYIDNEFGYMKILNRYMCGAIIGIS